MAETAPRSIRIAILAMGGEGGGVLAGWLVDLAEANGYIAQQTSIPGVAQRTGATNYYVELFPGAVGVRPLTAAGPLLPHRIDQGSDPKSSGSEVGVSPLGSTLQQKRTGLGQGSDPRMPVMALSPMPGDVDIVLASELMEAGRAIQRGIVTPDRTTLIASSGRVYAMSERLAPGDGRTDDTALMEAARLAALRLVVCDMGRIAEETGSVISAVMLGALAAADVLPFSAAQYEATIERGGVGVAASKRGFARGLAAAKGEVEAPPSPPAKAVAAPAPTSAVNMVLTEASTAFAEPVRAIAAEGARRLVDYQDTAYARLFVDRLKPLSALDRQHGDGSFRLTAETARYLALGMAYEDTIRVAELKIRAERFKRVGQEVKVGDGQLLRIAEFLHPRVQEIAETVPGVLGRVLERSRIARALVAPMTRKGRIVETTSIRGFLLLYAVARLKPRRRATTRYGREQHSLEAWLALIAATAPKDYALACEIAECRNLVKGYGDTHARGTAKYTRILGLVPRLDGHSEPARHVALLRSAALAEESDAKLEDAIARLGLA